MELIETMVSVHEGGTPNHAHTLHIFLFKILKNVTQLEWFFDHIAFQNFDQDFIVFF